jgi:nifR3 family TIM-barrel protein
MNFWNEMRKSFDLAQDKPILCLAPMADVTDAAFRFIISKYSKVKNQNKNSDSSSLKGSHTAQNFCSDFSYVTYTEFVSADGLVLAPEKGRKKLLKDLEYSEIERPIVAQFFTSKPEMMEKAAQVAVELGFDGIDINMGCPDKSIEKQKAGAALIKDTKLAREIIVAAKKGVAEAAKRLNKKEIPISVKTRLGYSKDELETWLPELLAENPAAIIIHARTRKEMSKVPARWERIKKAVEIRNNFGSKTLIIGNGDVTDTDDGRRKCEETGADGVMLGRAVFGNPWLFSDYQPTLEEKLKVLVEHTKLFEEKFSGIKSFAIMKKHFKEYLKDPKTRDLRFKLMRAEDVKDIERMVNDYLKSLCSR